MRYDGCVKCWLSNNDCVNLKFSKPKADILYYLHKYFQIYCYLLTFLQSNLFNICKHWKSFDPHCMASKVWTLSAGIQLSSLSVPSYPSQHTKYCSLHFYYRSILESSISNISNSSSLSISTRDSGSWVWLDIILDMLGSSMEMWKTGWTAQNVLGSFFSV